MRFRVPQFLDVEDKIFGPLSFKQFIYLAGGGGAIIAIWYYTGNIFATFVIGLPIAVFSTALAFFKVNNKPFIYITEAFFKYIIGSKIYIWKKTPPKTHEEKGFEVMPKKEPVHASFSTQRLSNSKLKDLEWSVDVVGEKKED